MVKDVEKVRGNFHFVAFMERGRFSQPRIQVPKPQSAQRIASAVATVGTDIDRAEISNNGSRISEKIQAGAVWRRSLSRWRRAVGAVARRADATAAANPAVNSRTQVGANERNRRQSIRKESASQVPVRDDQRRPAGSPENTRDIPSTDHFVGDAVAKAELVSAPRRQIVIEDGVEDVCPVEE